MSADWPLIPLGELVDFKTGKLDSNASVEGGKYPFFTCSPTTLAIDTYAFDVEAVLLAGNNANGIFPVKYHKGRFNAYQRTYVVTPKDPESLSVKWLYFRTKHVTAELQQMSVGSATKFLTKKILDAYKIPLPPIDVQRYQAGILWSIQDKIQLNHQINQTLEQMAQAIFKSWFVDFEPVKAKIAALEAGGSAADAELAAMRAISGRFLPDADASAAGADPLAQMALEQPEQYAELQATAALFPAAMQASELGEVPEGWEVGKLKDVAKYPNDRVCTEELSLDTYVSTECMVENKKGVSQASSLPSAATVPSFKENQILVSNIRPYFKKIWLAHYSGGRSPDVLCFESTEDQGHGFLFNVLYQDCFFDYMMRTSKGAKMPRGDKKAVMEFGLTVPPSELISLYSQSVSGYYQLAANKKAENESLASLRDTLLPKLLSGELTLPEAEAPLLEAAQ